MLRFKRVINSHLSPCSRRVPRSRESTWLGFFWRIVESISCALATPLFVRSPPLLPSQIVLSHLQSYFLTKLCFITIDLLSGFEPRCVAHFRWRTRSSFPWRELLGCSVTGPDRRHLLEGVAVWRTNWKNTRASDLVSDNDGSVTGQMAVIRLERNVFCCVLEASTIMADEVEVRDVSNA